jgi:hypothetical protein
MDRRYAVCFRRPLETVINAVLDDTKVLFGLRSSADNGAALIAAFGTDERNILLFSMERRR